MSGDAEGPTAAEVVAKALGHRFRDPALLEMALTHSSHAHESGGGVSNERLEFLGDAVLDLVVARALFESQPAWREGDLTRARAALVTKAALAGRARALDLGRALRLGRTEQRSGGAEKDTILADCFEALLGAVYLDGGLEAAAGVVRRTYGPLLSERLPARDPKTHLQEWSHAHLSDTPAYRLLEDQGEEAGEARFRAEVRVGDVPRGCGQGRSKQQAEQAAARDALVRLGAPDPGEPG